MLLVMCWDLGGNIRFSMITPVLNGFLKTRLNSIVDELFSYFDKHLDRPATLMLLPAMP